MAEIDSLNVMSLPDKDTVVVYNVDLFYVCILHNFSSFVKVIINFSFKITNIVINIGGTL